MLFLFTILAVLFAVALLAALIKRHESSSLLPENQQNNISAENFRPLFAPDEDDLRAFADERKQLRAKAEQAERELFAAEKLEKAVAFQAVWQNLPDKQNTIEFVRLAAATGDGRVFQAAAREIIRRENSGEIRELSAEQIAQLLESHFWLLPAQQRTSGEKFWLNQTIAGLRRKFQK